RLGSIELSSSCPVAHLIAPLVGGQKQVELFSYLRYKNNSLICVWSIPAHKLTLSAMKPSGEERQSREPGFFVFTVRRVPPIAFPRHPNLGARAN
ncbi:MAG: hypothetical protein ACREDR_20320, partial [Blastocatellia bacterium]